MGAVIVARHNRQDPSPFEVGPQAMMVLESLPGVSEVRVDSEDLDRATLSYRWKDPASVPHPSA